MKKIANKRGGIARTAGKQWPKLVAMLVSASLVTGQILANPVGPQVISGQASFSTQGNVLTVTNSPGAIINWQNFSINPNEITRFIQQNASSSVLNRITGQNPSQILGALQSNGRVFLINPNGIVFGQGSQINVGSLIASTLNISNEDFLAGRMNFKAGAAAGDLKNQGSIATPDGGQIVLIAPNVENSGLITSPKGEVLLAAGRSVQLVDTSNPSVQVVVSAPDNQALNLGQVIAQGGKIGVYGGLINQRGIVNANSAVVGENGKIIFKASGDTLLDAGSVTSATGEGQGGEIQVLGNRVGLLGDAKVDASGNSNGGTVLIGGDYQGKNSSIQNAKQSYVSADASIKADAIQAGNGGKVIVWSDDATRVHGTISARGGVQSGNGGFVETSGHYLNVDGVSVDARAPKGKNGTWLLDPYDIRVVAGGGVNSTSVMFADPNVDGINNRTDINASAINAANASVLLQATHDIVFQSAVNISAAGVGLAAQAGNNIVVGSTITTNGGTIKLIANDAGGPSSGTGTLTVSSALTSGGGLIELAGNTSTINANLLSGGGTIDLAAGSGGISVPSSTVTIGAGAGTITLTSAGGITSSGGSTISASNLNMVANGNIAVTGTQISNLGITQNCTTCTVQFQNNVGNLAVTGINAAGNSINLTNLNGAISGGTITGSSLSITASGDISVSSAVGSLSAYASSTGQISVNNSGALSVNTIDAGTNVNISTNGSMTIVGSTTTNSNNAAGTYTFSTSNGNLDVTATGSVSNVNGSINLAADHTNGPYTLTTATGSNLSSTGGVVTLKAGGAITTNGTITGTSSLQPFLYSTTTTTTSTTSSSSTSTTSTSTTSTSSTTTSSTSTSSTSTTSTSSTTSSSTSTSSTSTTSTSSTTSSSTSTSSTSTSSTSTSSTTSTTASTTTTTLKPPGSDCASNPSLSTCQTSSNSVQTQVGNTVIDSINSASKELSTSGDGKLSTTLSSSNTGENKKEDEKDKEKVVAGADKSGAKKNAVKKLYCN